MSIIKNIALALVLSTAAILPAAAAEGIIGDGSSYSKEQAQRVMPNRPAVNQQGTRSFFLQDRGYSAPRAGVSMRQESAPGFGG